MNCCCKSDFWIGLGVGSLLGAVACHVARSRQAKELKDRVCDAMHHAGEKAGELIDTLRENALKAGAGVAGKAAVE